MYKKPQNQPKSNKFIFLSGSGVWRAGETRLKPAKQPKKRSEVEPGVAGDHTPTLKSELGYLRLESLQALGNGDFEEYSYFHAYGGLDVSKISVESKFVAYSRAGRSGVRDRRLSPLLRHKISLFFDTYQMDLFEIRGPHIPSHIYEDFYILSWCTRGTPGVLRVAEVPTVPEIPEVPKVLVVNLKMAKIVDKGNETNFKENDDVNQQNEILRKNQPFIKDPNNKLKKQRVGNTKSKEGQNMKSKGMATVQHSHGWISSHGCRRDTETLGNNLTKREREACKYGLGFHLKFSKIVMKIFGSGFKLSATHSVAKACRAVVSCVVKVDRKDNGAGGVAVSCDSGSVEADLVEADCALLELVSEDSGGVEMQGVNRIENPQFSQ
ncbi:hypothetical protein WN944_006688 [Citrus x changshan-huyou]|uniref:Uncharacterized protein n=1 Tax=Citrus x changshan-huyou TaxID=2935761 RepID=A0AAP0MLT4_9ROSI